MKNVKRKTSPAHPGSVFSQLTVIGAPVTGPDGNYLPCQCECGRPVFVLWRVLNSGGRKSCGNCRVVRKTERLYTIWGGMKSRCRDQNFPSYRHYGGRGITVCPAWLEYPLFRAWALANGYQAGLTLERVDVNGNYEPSNCTWIPLGDQARNRRSNLWFEYDGERRILKDWADDPRCAVTYSGLYRRVVTGGWDFRDALTAPLGSRRPPASD